MTVKTKHGLWYVVYASGHIACGPFPAEFIAQLHLERMQSAEPARRAA